MKGLILLLVVLCGVWETEQSCLEVAKESASNGPMPGGWSQSNTTEEILALLDKALATTDDDIVTVKDGGKTRVRQVYSQTVAGMNYCFEFEGNKGGPDNPNDCGLNSEHNFCTNTKVCTAKIFEQVWTATIELVNMQCQERESMLMKSVGGDTLSMAADSSGTHTGRLSLMLIAGLLMLLCLE